MNYVDRYTKKISLNLADGVSVQQFQANSLSQAKSLLEEKIGNIGRISADGTMVVTQREAQFLLWQFHQLEENRKTAHDQLLEVECQVTTDLERLHMFGSRYLNPVDPRGAQLKDRLAAIKEKRQRLEMDIFDRQCRCLERLSILVGRQELLGMRS